MFRLWTQRRHHIHRPYGWALICISLQYRHNERDGVPNDQPRYCLLNCLSKRRSKKTPKLRVTGLCEGNLPVTGEFPAQRARNAENVSIWWRHHVFELGGEKIPRDMESALYGENIIFRIWFSCYTEEHEWYCKVDMHGLGVFTEYSYLVKGCVHTFVVKKIIVFIICYYFHSGIIYDISPSWLFT